MEQHDPAVGDPVLIHGVIRSIEDGVAAVEIYRSWPLGITVPVQAGALDCDERAAHGANGGASDEVQPG